MSPQYDFNSTDDILNRICQHIQLSPKQYRMAEARYQAIGEHLTAADTHLDRLSPQVASQGSMLQRTTVRPMRMGEDCVPFDLDSFCKCDFDPFASTSQSLYGSVRTRLEAKREFKDRIADAEKKFPPTGKCIRLAYIEDDFYLDSVPMCVDATDADGKRMFMARPDRWHDFKKPIETWRATDPIRLAEWIEIQAFIPTLALEERAAASVAPIPDQEPVQAKAPLRRVIQLLKRHRDLAFLGDDCKPTSILLSVLAGRHYRKQVSIAAGLAAVIDGTANQIQAAGSRRIEVINPADEMSPHAGGFEDLAKAMTDSAYAKFCKMILDLQRNISRIASAKSVGELRVPLVETAGEGPVKAAMRSVQIEARDANLAERIVAPSVVSGIRVAASGAAAAVGIHVKGSTFHSL